MKQTLNSKVNNSRLEEIESLYIRMSDNGVMTANDADELRRAVRDLLKMNSLAADEHNIALQRALGMANHYLQILIDGSCGTLELAATELIGCVPPHSPVEFSNMENDLPF